MRSEDVFAATKNIGNRFLLCRVVSVSARHLQKGPKQFTESINKSFKLIASMSAPGDKNDKNGVAGDLQFTFGPLGVNSAGNTLDPPPVVKPGFAPLGQNLTAR